MKVLVNVLSIICIFWLLAGCSTTRHVKDGDYLLDKVEIVTDNKNFKGADLGTVLSFMMAVTTLSLPSMIMLSKVVQAPLLRTFVAVCTIGIILVGYLFNLLQGWFI